MIKSTKTFRKIWAS